MHEQSQASEFLETSSYLLKTNCMDYLAWAPQVKHRRYFWEEGEISTADISKTEQHIKTV